MATAGNGDRGPPAEGGEEVAGSPGPDQVGLLHRLLLTWLVPLCRLPGKREITRADVPLLPDAVNVCRLGPRVDAIWAEENARPDNRRALWRTIARTFKREIARGLAMSFVAGFTLAAVRPLLLKLLIEEAASDDDDVSGSPRAYYLAAIVSSMLLVEAFTTTQAKQALAADVGVGWLGAMAHLIQAKSLRLAPAASGKVSEAGLMGLDVVQRFEALRILSMVPMAIVAFVAGVVVLVVTIGTSGLIGMAIIAGALVVNILIGMKTAQVEERLMESSDIRLDAVTRLVTCIKAIKFSAWEPFFEAQVDRARLDECAALRTHKSLQLTVIQLGRAAPIIAASSSFVFLALTGEEMKASNVFAALNVFQALRQSLILIPLLFSNGVALLVSLARIQAFLQLPEITPWTVLPEASPLAVQVHRASFRWVFHDPAAGGRRSRAAKKTGAERKRERRAARQALEAGHPPPTNEPCSAVPDTLHGVSAEVARGLSVAVVGRVGQGKSSFLAALVNGMVQTAGEPPAVEGDVGYITQRPFIVAGSVAHNITMGRALDEDRLAEVVDLACMQRDLESFPHGQHTELGERGTTLSGGQMQRICIARALYGNPALLIADDPLSAVDSLVGVRLFDGCFSKYAEPPSARRPRGATLVMALNQLQFLPRFDYAVLFVDGRIACQGPPAKLIAEHPALCAFKHTTSTDSLGSFESVEAEVPSVEQAIKEMQEDRESVDVVLPSAGDAAEPVSSPGAPVQRETDYNVLVRSETVKKGRVNGKVVWQYLKGMGYMRMVVDAVLLLCAYITMGFTDLFLSYWVAESEDAADRGESFDNVPYSIIYGGSSLAFLAFLVVYAFVYARAITRAGKNVHDACVRRVIRAPVSWFEETPAGRLLSRFSTDLGVVDNLMTTVMDGVVNFFFTLLVIVVIICLVIPYLIPLIVVCGALYGWVVRTADAPNRVVKRMANNANSPLLSTLTEIAGGQGKLVIRAMHLGDMYTHRFNGQLALYQRLHYCSSSLMHGATLFAYIASFVVASTAAFSMLTLVSVEPSQMGLALTYSFMAPYFLQFLAMMSVVLITCFTSLERLLECTSDLIPQEPEWFTVEDAALAPRNWPATGCIEFHQTQLVYRPGLPPSLKGIDLTLRGGTRVGIVGRTGAGKSSLLVLLFRLVEASSGAVLVDGVDIKKLGLQTLRKAMSIIPQEPLLMEGSVRYNIDSTGEYTDEQVLDAMRMVGLSPHLMNHEVGEGAVRTSAGERQLISLARTLLRKARIIVMDEPTSNIDLASDTAIQQSLRGLQNVTIITIAHRLDSIIDSDTIVVMDQGNVAQHGTAAELLSKPGIFLDMVNGLGPATANSLKLRAAIAHKIKGEGS